MALEPTKHRFTATEYAQMGQAGIFAEDDRLELIDGEIVEMTPIGGRHAACVKGLNRLFSRGLGDAALVSIQDPVHLGEYSEPQPDVALLRPRADRYAAGHPTPDAIFLIVEVAETSSTFDRRVKLPLYARSRVPEVWLVDLAKETVTVYCDPAAAGYRTAQTLRRGETLSPLAFPDLELAVDDILG